MRILIVDDSAMMRKILTTQLSGFGISDIVEAVDGNHGLQVLQDNQPVDIIILDWNMPVMDGLTFLKTVRSNAAYNNVRIVMCTSESEKKRVVEAVSQGASNYIIKPFTPEILKEKLGL